MVGNLTILMRHPWGNNSKKETIAECGTRCVVIDIQAYYECL